MFASIVVFYALPFLHTSKIRSSIYRPIYKKFFWVFLVNGLILGWIGQSPVEDPYYTIGQIATGVYFFYLLILVPVIGLVENYLLEYNNTEK